MIAIGLTAAAVAVAGGVYLGPHLVKPLQIRRLRALCRRTRTLVLTYDDGPGPNLTPRVLERLEAAGVKATFFLLGMRAERAPATADEVLAAGHEVGCHSHEHVNGFKAWPGRGLQDLNAGYRTLARWVAPDAMFRPPCGKLTLPVWLALRRRGAPLGWWTVDSGDTHNTLPDPASVAEQVRGDGGGVVLMHDFDRDPPSDGPRAAFVLETTDRLLDLAARDGLAVRPLGELLRQTANS